MTLYEFVVKYTQPVGVHIDEDGAFGAQCWDVSARYAREVLSCPSFPTGSGGAEGLYRLFLPPIPDFFERIPLTPGAVPAPGDVIVWLASFDPPSGHTAVCITADQSGITSIEQNGDFPDGTAYIKTRSYVGVAGWLRPKKGTTMSQMTHDEARWTILGLYGNEPTEGEIAPYIGTDYELSQKQIQRECFNAGRDFGTYRKAAQKVIDVKDGVIADQQKQIESLKAQVGDNTKWETLKALIRELVKG